MSGKLAKTSWLQFDWSASVPVFRYVVGAVFIVLVTGLMNYELAYLTAVLGLGYLAPGARPLKPKQAAGILLSLAGLTGIAVVFSEIFLDYPIVFLPMLLLGLLWIYYSKFPLMLKLFALISVVLIPFLSINSAVIGRYIAVILVFNAFMAIVLTQLMFLFIPLNEADKKYEKKKKAEEDRSEHDRFAYALSILFILGPVMFLFYMFQWSSALLILTFISILTVSPSLSNPKVGMVMVVANILGGVFGILAYQLLVMVPNFTFMLLMTALVGLIFADRLFSDRKAAPIFGSAFSTFLLILGSVSASDAEAGDKVWSRVVQISIAVIYVVVAFGLLDRIKKIKSEKRAGIGRSSDQQREVVDGNNNAE